MLIFIFSLTSLTMTNNMALRNSTAGTLRLVGFLVTPSWSSSILTLVISLCVVAGTILLTHYGSGAQQSLLGLHSVYSKSSVGTGTNIVGQHLSSNALFNNAVLFVLWGSVGLMVYSVVQGIAKEFKNTGDLLHELNYVHVDRHKVLGDAATRAMVRFAALAVWWLLGWTILHKIFPYAIATAHVTAYHLSDVSSWLHTLLGFGLCVVSMHGLIVCLRLMILRPRLTGNSIIDS